MSLPRFTWTDRAYPVLQIGLGRSEYTSALWDQAHWDVDVWGGAEPEWRDVSCDAFTFRCEYGRQRTTDRFVVGQATVVVWNATGWADPDPVDQPGVMNMRPGRPIRVGVVHKNLGTRWLFRGFIDSLTPTYDPTQPDTVELSCIDALGEVNRAKVLPLGTPMYGGDPVDVRIGRLLDMASWPESKRLLSPTGDTLIASDMGGQLADLLGQAADSGGGNVYGDTDGNVVYRARDWQTFEPGTPPDGTIGNVNMTYVPGYTVPAQPAQPGYLDLTLGTATTPDTADMAQASNGPVRLTVRARWDALPASGFPVVVQKQGAAGVSEREYMLFTAAAAAYGSTATVAGANGQITLGNLTAGATQTVGWEMTRGVTAATSIIDDTRTARTWSPGAAGVPDSTAPVIVGAVAAGRTGRVYWAQLEAINRAQLVFYAPPNQWLSTPNVAVTGDIEIVARIAPARWAPPTTPYTVVARWQESTNQRSYLLRLLTTGVLRLNISTDGVNNAGAADTPVVPGVSDGAARWIKVTRARTSGIVQFWYAPDSPLEPTSWTRLGSDVVVAAGGAPYAGSAPTQIGGYNVDGGQPFVGRIARVKVRTAIGTGAAPLLDVAENDAGTTAAGADTFTATTGQTMTLNGGTGIILRLPSWVVWRFDASEYPGTGVSYVDPRGRSWTVTPGAVVPYVPAVPEVVVPPVWPDVCPVLWERPFARADMATRVLIGRDAETAQQLDDEDGQALYGIEPFERTDLLTERDDKITLLGTRILRVRSALAAPRIRSVTLDARTTDSALDLMTTVNVFKPSRYRCRLLLDRGLVFDAEHFATGVAHDMSASSWQVLLNLDQAAPYAAAGGRWDGAYWDQATWATPV